MKQVLFDIVIKSNF